MDDEPAADDARRTVHDRDEVHLDAQHRVARRVGFERWKIAGVTLRHREMGVLFAERVEVPTGAQAIAGAAIAPLMHMIGLSPEIFASTSTLSPSWVKVAVPFTVLPLVGGS